ncbi:MAG: hypothetical protein II359_02805, partial [Clostridia bacterium]|nr:hypothetical protein [Clostridia bacterium]
YMKLRAINTGTSTLTLHRKEAWHFEATSTTYTIVVGQRPISYDGIEATYTKKLTYGGNYKNTNISLTDSHGSSYFGTTTLEKDTHYTVELSDNFYPGTMKIKITGMGLYSGSRTYSVTIAPRTLALEAAAYEKEYDGTTVGTGTITATNIVDGDDVLISANFTFAQKNVGTDIPVTADQFVLSGEHAHCYTIEATQLGAVADIIPRLLKASLIAVDKTYDGGTSALGTLSLDNVVSGDSVNISASSITFADKNVGSDKIVTAAGLSLDNANYTLSSDSVTSTANITAKTIYPHVTADSKTYDATTDIHNGTLYLDGIIGADSVELQAESFAFDSPLPGERNAVAEKLYLIGTDKDNYTLSTDTCTMPAMISPYELTHVTCVSQYINTATAQLMQGDIQKALPFTLPANCTYHYSSGTFGTVTTDYVRVADYAHALGKITDTMIFDIQVDDITIVYGNISVTTGTRTVYGNNQFTTPHDTMTSSIMRFEDTWTEADNNNVYIETNTPTDVTFKVYLYQGEKLNVGTDIGLYHGRVDVTIKKGESEQAIDKIDAFFPVSYEEEYTISNMHSSRVQNEINPDRNDYWSAVPEFIASEDGLYNVTMHVTGSSYLLDAQKGLGTMYQGNDPADPPETSLRYITIQ